MKNIVLLFVLAIFAFACTNKPAEPASYTANKVVNLSVEGMTCNGCEQTIQEAVLKINGVTEVKASYLDSLVVVSFDSTATGPDAFAQAITDAGYDFKGLK